MDKNLLQQVIAELITFVPKREIDLWKFQMIFVSILRNWEKVNSNIGFSKKVMWQETQAYRQKRRFGNIFSVMSRKWSTT